MTEFKLVYFDVRGRAEVNILFEHLILYHKDYNQILLMLDSRYAA